MSYDITACDKCNEYYLTHLGACPRCDDTTQRTTRKTPKKREFAPLQTNTPRKQSKLERDFALLMDSAGFTYYEREYRFHKTRRWRADFAFVQQRILVELEGGVWTRGRHTRGQGFIDDCDKYNEAVADGWRVIRFTSEHLKEPRKVLNLMNRVLGA